MSETQAQLTAQIDAFIAQNERALLDDLKALIAVDSVEGTPAPGAPFGAGPRKALDVALGMAKRFGMQTNDGDGYVGWGELPGREKGHLATITHLDVVPVGNGWTGDPFAMREREGWVIGRGVADDKGPSILCLYAAKFFAEQGETLRYPLRVLLGCNEESGMGDVGYYLEHNEQPLFCFSPDAGFPVCNGEKGVFTGTFSSAALYGNLLDFAGGVASNVVPDRASCLVKADAAKLAPTDRVAVAAEGEGAVRLSAEGIGGHAAHPEGTLNAIGLLVNYLLDNGLCTEEENGFLRLLKKLHDVTDGSGLGIACSDDLFDPLTCIGGTIAMQEGKLYQGINIRYPMAIDDVQLNERLLAEARACGGGFVSERANKPFYIPADAPPIQTLLDTYNEVTGKQEKPFTMGGGTYARHFTSAVSYGPEKDQEDKPDFAGPIHGADEAISVAALLEALKIYILAIHRLEQLDF